MRVVGPGMPGMVPTSVYGDSAGSAGGQAQGQGPMYMSPGHGQVGQGPMGQGPPQQQPQQQHHHPNAAPSPAQQHTMAQTPTGNPPQQQQQLIYQTAGQYSCEV